MKSLLTILLIGFLSACSATHTHSGVIDPDSTLRVAIMPFVFESQQPETARPTANLVIESVNPLASKPTGLPTQVARRLVEGRLTRDTSYDLIDPFITEIQLMHEGYANDQGEFRVKKIQSEDPKTLCNNVVLCDAVLFGTIKEWDSDYYGIEAVNTIDIEVKLVSAHTGKVIFDSRSQDEERCGISGGPTGFADIALAPIECVSAQSQEALAAKVVADIFAPFRDLKAKNQNGSSPPAIYASAHTITDGIVGSNETVTVLLYATPGVEASFSVEPIISDIPMIEKSEGHYVGEYIPYADDFFQHSEITITLKDKYQRVSKAKVSGLPISRGQL